MEAAPPPYRYAHDEAMLLNSLLTKSSYSKNFLLSPILGGGSSAAFVTALI
jgi:hypothetical protein